jgi:hypothetical protein
MTHILLFVGLSATLVDAIKHLEKRSKNRKFLAIPSKNVDMGINNRSITAARKALYDYAATLSVFEPKKKLSIWGFLGEGDADFSELWDAFGKVGWIQKIPAPLQHQIPKLKDFLESHAQTIEECLHFVAHSIVQKRGLSPLPLPHRNFYSKENSHRLEDNWNQGASSEVVKLNLKAVFDRYQSRHRKTSGTFRDDRGLLFSASKHQESHGIPHPTGIDICCYIEGLFRYGAALPAGFHYDVRDEQGNLKCTLYDCKGTPRNMKSENKEYINIYPNDQLRP